MGPPGMTLSRGNWSLFHRLAGVVVSGSGVFPAPVVSFSMIFRFLILPLLLLVNRAAEGQVLFRDNPAARRDSTPARFSVTRLGTQPQVDVGRSPESELPGELSDEEVTAWLDSLGASVSAGMTSATAARFGWASLPYQLPLSRAGGVRLSSGYGLRSHPVLGVERHHNGIDLATPAHSPVYATADGVVAGVHRSAGLGLSVTLRHAHGLQTVYGHLSRCDLRTGQPVRRGQRVGAVGSTGRSTGPHLHYALRQGGRYIDPLRFSALVRAHLADKPLPKP